MQQIVFEEDIKKDSLLVTPIGICLNFYEQSNNFIFVSFNDSRIKIYDNNKLNVADAAMQVQFPNDGLFPKRGKELNFTVNGKQRMARGQLGEAAVITINGQTADIHSPIHANDIIKVIESTAGEKAKMTVGDLSETTENLTVLVNEKKIEVPRFACVNGVLQSKYYEIQEGDSIEILNYYTVGQIIAFMDVVLDPHMNLYVNHMLADRDTPVYENFSVSWTFGQAQRMDADVGDMEEADEIEDAYIEPADMEETKDEVKQEYVKDKESGSARGENVPGEESAGESEADKKSIQVIVNHSPITLSGKDRYIYVDVFDAIDIDLSRPRGKGIVTTLNGRRAQYMEPIAQGDVIEVYWRS